MCHGCEYRARVFVPVDRTNSVSGHLRAETSKSPKIFFSCIWHESCLTYCPIPQLGRPIYGKHRRTSNTNFAKAIRVRPRARSMKSTAFLHFQQSCFAATYLSFRYPRRARLYELYPTLSARISSLKIQSIHLRHTEFSNDKLHNFLDNEKRISAYPNFLHPFPYQNTTSFLSVSIPRFYFQVHYRRMIPQAGGNTRRCTADFT